MKRKPTSPLGALHPVLFFSVVYIIALFFSIFICSSVFYSCNSTTGEHSSRAKAKKGMIADLKSNTVASVK